MLYWSQNRRMYRRSTNPHEEILAAECKYCGYRNDRWYEMEKIYNKQRARVGVHVRGIYVTTR